MSGYTEIALLQYEIKKLRAERSALRAELREICTALDDAACDLVPTAVECIKKLKAENGSLNNEIIEDAKTIGKYNQLLMAVERKFPNESRHETALRYIKAGERKTQVIDAGMAKKVLRDTAMAKGENGC